MATTEMGICCLQCIRTNEVGVVEDLGQFTKLLDPGLHIICYPITTVAGRLSLRVQQLDVVCETKTKDNVFIQVRLGMACVTWLQAEINFLLNPRPLSFFRLQWLSNIVSSPRAPMMPITG